MGSNNSISGVSFIKKIGFFFSVFFVCLFLTATLSSLLLSRFGSSHSVVLTQIVLQNVLSFAVPAMLVAAFIARKPFEYLALSKSPKWMHVLFVILVYVVSVPAMNMIVQLNESITLPDSFAALEKLLRMYEEAAKALTNQLISGQTLMGVICLMLVLGCLTGFGEEIFFRGMLTRIFLDKPMNKHLAIWLGAIVFSFMHFQFFGFVPRVLMGALFGYMLVWSGSLWVPIIAHAINNSVVVLSTYALERGYLSQSLDVYGTTQCMPWLAIVSVAATVALIKYRKFFF